jgi:peptide/nickel transport system permease protein
MPDVTPGSVVAFADAPAVLPASRDRRALRAVVHDAAARLAAATLAIMWLAALLAPWLAPYDPLEIIDMIAGAQPPSAAHWFGTDPASRDLFSRVLFGARLSLGITAAAVAISMGIGTAWGAIAGFAGRWIDAALMRFVDAGLAMPRIILLLAIASFWGALTPAALAVVLGVTGWFGTSRLVRDEVRAVNTRDFTVAARALGYSPARVLVRHVLPHAITPMLVGATLSVGQVIVVEAGLSFLGYGLAPPAASWGSIIHDGQESLATAWWMSVFPGMALAITVLAINVLGDRLRAALGARQLPAP